MADHPTISTESNLASPALPTTAVTRRSVLGGAGIAVGAAVLASPPSSERRVTVVVGRAGDARSDSVEMVG